VAPVDLEELGQFVQRLTMSGIEFFPDDKTENHLRDVAGLPAVDPNKKPPVADDEDT
jgi:hypothetical protein